MISGLFEIHVTVDISDLVAFSLYCWEYKYKMMLACSKYGDHPQQLMLSSWKNGTEVEAIKNAKTIAEDIKLKGIRVLRTKVEAMTSNKEVPEDTIRFKKGTVYGVDHFYTDPSQEYFEYHIKIEIDRPGEYEVLAKTIEPVGAHLSFNGLNREKVVPIITLRVYNKGKNEADEIKDKMFDLLRQAGFITHEQIQKEYSVYDDNPELDLNWLYKKKGLFW